MQQHDLSDVDVQAACWATRLEDGDLTAAERQEFHAWLLEHPGHGDKFVGASLIPMLAKELPRERLGSQRRGQLLRFAGGLAAGAVPAFIAGFLFLMDSRLGTTTYETRTGELRAVSFNEGSVAYLNTRTQLRWRGEEGGSREVELIAGEAMFEIEHDERRPFVVALETSEIRVLGTTFSVYVKPGQQALVTVFEGAVEVRGRSRNGANSAAWVRTLSANEQMEYSSTGPTTEPHLTNVALAKKWREGQLELPEEGAPLPTVISELSRYTDKQIVVRDPRLMVLKVGGSFTTRDVRQALARMTTFMPMTVRVEEHAFVLEYRADDEQ